MNVLSTAPSDWTLKAEGGAKLVLSYSGSDASFSSLVLRVRKRKLHAVSKAEEPQHLKYRLALKLFHSQPGKSLDELL